jgi:hypothetical protein
MISRLMSDAIKLGQIEPRNGCVKFPQRFFDRIEGDATGAFGGQNMGACTPDVCF